MKPGYADPVKGFLDGTGGRSQRLLKNVTREPWWDGKVRSWRVERSAEVMRTTVAVGLQTDTIAA